MIPKIVHAIWLGDKPIPPEYNSYINGWKQILPDYKIKIWHDSDFDGIGDENEFLEYCKQNRKYAFLSDWYRLYILYEYGGIYIDTDVKVLKKFDDFLASKFFLSFIVDSSLQTAIFGAEKGNEIIKKLLVYLEEEFSKDGTLKSNNEWVTKYFLDNFPDFKLNGHEQHLKCGVDIYPKTYFDAYPSIFDFSGKGGYSVHFCAGSWIEKKEAADNPAKEKLKKVIKSITPDFVFRQRNYINHVKQAKEYPYYDVYLDTIKKKAD